MIRKFLGKPMTWLVALAALAMAFGMTAGYLSAFLNPEQYIHDFPIGIVNSDAGISILGQSRNVGNDIIGTVTSANSSTAGKVDWRQFGSRDDLIAAINRNEVYGGIVIPKDFTSSIAGIVRPQLASGKPQAAKLELLYNHGGGSIAGSNGRTIIEGVGDTVEQQALKQVQSSIGSTAVDPKLVPLVAHPVQFVKTDVVPTGAHTGAGMGPTYVGIVSTVGGLLAAIIVNLGIDFIAGHGSLGPRFERWRGAPVPATLRDMSELKVALVTAVYLLATAITTFIALHELHLPVASSWKFAAVVFLGMLAAGGPTLLFISLIGTPGVILGLLLTTILGVPSSGGVFPFAMLPDFYRALGKVLPMRYVVDAVRSLVYFGGRNSAGMGTWWVLAVWGVGGMILALAASMLIQKLRGDHVSPHVLPASETVPTMRDLDADRLTAPSSLL